MTRILVDADACPVREEIYRVAGRLGLAVLLVTNGSRPIRPPALPNARLVVVPDGADIADDWIASEIAADDVCVTADIPLAANAVSRGATVTTYAEVVAFPAYEKNVTLHCVEGWSADILWRGVRLRDLLDRAGVKPSARTVIFHCDDGYTTSLPLDVVVDKDLLLAYKMNGVDLPSERGFPFEVVAESKYGYKWAKWVTEIELSSDADYLGYWERRGYDNRADVPGE